jgi:subtilisin family serine protease
MKNQNNIKADLLFKIFISLTPVLTVLFSSLCVAQEMVAGEYIVQRNPSVSAVRALQRSGYTLHKSANIELLRPGSGLYSSARTTIPYDSNRVSADCGEIMKDPSIISCEPNLVRYLYKLPNDPGFPELWGLHSPKNNIDINAPEAWDITTGSGNVVAVIDTGISYRHPDLISNLWTNPNEIDDNNYDDDGNGYVDDMFGANVYYADGNPWDCDGHGTHVAGIIAAAGNNNLGVTGVTWNTKIMSVSPAKCEVEPEFYTSDIIRALNYILDQKVNGGIPISAVNASFGGPGYSEAVENAIRSLRDANIVFVCAAGNMAQNNDSVADYPGNYNVDNIISVAAVSQAGNLSEWSNYGVNNVDIAAPGEEIISTWIPDAGDEDIYAAADGTSMAAPYVTGSVSLLFSHRPDSTYSEIIAALYNGASYMSSLNKIAGNRMLDLRGGLEALDPSISPVPTPTPDVSPTPRPTSPADFPNVILEADFSRDPLAALAKKRSNALLSFSLKSISALNGEMLAQNENSCMYNLYASTKRSAAGKPNTLITSLNAANANQEYSLSLPGIRRKKQRKKAAKIFLMAELECAEGRSQSSKIRLKTPRKTKLKSRKRWFKEFRQAIQAAVL